MKKHWGQEKITLPRTEQDFDDLIAVLMKKYKLPNEEHCIAIVGNCIMRMPVDQITTTLDHLGHSVIKNIAYQVAKSKASKVHHKFQIDELDALLTANPMNQEAIDALQKAINEGSEYAKTILAKYREPHVADVIPIEAKN
jgi:hypothetical protein